MKGKLGIVVGLAAGYVLGARAGRERYEQIKIGAQNLWETAPVQKQVDKVKDLGKTAALAVPSVVWDSAVKVTRAATKKGATPGQKLDGALTAGKQAADDVEEAAEQTAAAAKSAAASAKSTARKATTGSTAKKSSSS